MSAAACRILGHRFAPFRARRLTFKGQLGSHGAVVHQWRCQRCGRQQ